MLWAPPLEGLESKDWALPGQGAELADAEKRSTPSILFPTAHRYSRRSVHRRLLRLSISVARPGPAVARGPRGLTQITAAAPRPGRSSSPPQELGAWRPALPTPCARCHLRVVPAAACYAAASVGSAPFWRPGKELPWLAPECVALPVLLAPPPFWQLKARVPRPGAPDPTFFLRPSYMQWAADAAPDTASPPPRTPQPPEPHPASGPAFTEREFRPQWRPSPSAAPPRLDFDDPRAASQVGMLRENRLPASPTPTSGPTHFYNQLALAPPCAAGQVGGRANAGAGSVPSLPLSLAGGPRGRAAGGQQAGAGLHPGQLGGAAHLLPPVRGG
jgi:hypothetical protein